MWLAFFLTLLSLSFLGMSNYYHSEFVLSRTVDEKTVAEIVEIKNRFVFNTKPLLRASIRDLPQFSHDFELVEPAGALPKTHLYPYQQVKILFEGMKTCRWPSMSSIHPHLEKAIFFQQYLCEQQQTLPADFFLKPPFLHPLGFSYVHQAFSTQRPEFRNPEWLKKHKDYVHVSELRFFRESVKLNEWQLLISRLSDAHYRVILEGQPVVLTENNLLISMERDPKNENFPIYQVFSRNDFSSYLSQTIFSVSEGQEQDFCLYREGNMGWYLNRDFLGRLSGRYLYLSAFSFLVLLINIFWLVFQQIQRKIAEHKDRTFILRTLTHELRTPVAGLQMGIEPLRKYFDLLPEDGQICFLRMADSVRRLKRVIEASSQYLYSESGSRGMLFNFVRYDSICAVLEDVLEQNMSKINFFPPPVDCSFILDVYWFTVCVRNLVDNALTHGKAPVEVRAVVQDGVLSITVSDQGMIPKKELLRYLRPFARHYSHENLGLGLSLVRTIVEQMGGGFEVKACPTAMIIRLENARVKE